MTTYLVLRFQLNQQSFPVSKVIVYPVISDDIDVSQNPISTVMHPHVQVFS